MSATSPTIPEGPIVGRGAFSPLFDVVRHFTSFLKWRFSLAPQGSYRWVETPEGSPEEKDTEIWISADTPLRTATVGKRPAITVLRSAAVMAGLGIGDKAFVDLATGAKVRMDMIPTNICINCLSQEPVEAEGLAWFIRKEVSAFRDEICKESKGLILYTGSKISMSPPSPAGSLVDTTESDWIVVVLAIPTYLQIQDTLLPLNKPVVKQVNTTLTTVPGTTGVPGAPGSPAPVALLQGSAISQPVQTQIPTPLPQSTPDEAQSSEPLTVQIETK